MKRLVPLLIASFAGFAIIVSTFIPSTEGWGQQAMIWFNILAAAAFVLGGGNLMKIHLKRISDRRAGWGYSIVTLAAFLVTLFVGLFKIGAAPSGEFPNYAWSGTFNAEGSASLWVYDYLVSPITATMFAMLAFYIASASFRAFRAKNIEAALLLGTAFIILLGRTYAGVFLTGWLPEIAPENTDPNLIERFVHHMRLDRLNTIVMDVFNTAGTRAITIGIALGVVSTSLKVLLGVDRSYLGSEKE